MHLNARIQLKARKNNKLREYPKLIDSLLDQKKKRRSNFYLALFAHLRSLLTKWMTITYDVKWLSTATNVRISSQNSWETSMHQYVRQRFKILTFLGRKANSTNNRSTSNPTTMKLRNMLTQFVISSLNWTKILSWKWSIVTSRIKRNRQGGKAFPLKYRSTNLKSQHIMITMMKKKCLKEKILMTLVPNFIFPRKKRRFKDWTNMRYTDW